MGGFRDPRSVMSVRCWKLWLKFSQTPFHKEKHAASSSKRCPGGNLLAVLAKGNAGAGPMSRSAMDFLFKLYGNHSAKNESASQ